MYSFGQAPDWLWAKRAGGSNYDGAYSVAVDASSNAYIAGYFLSPTITFGSTTLTNAGSYDLFIAKYDVNGNVLWAKRAGGTSEDEAYSVAVDDSGNVYITGYFASTTISFGSTTMTNTGSHDIFLVKYDINGNVLWAKNAGGTDCDEAYTVAVDNSGNIYIAGWFLSATVIFDTTTVTGVGAGDIFLSKYNNDGNLLWAKSAGGTIDDEANSIAVDDSGNIYLAGCFQSPTINFGTYTLTNVGSYDIFLVKYDTVGNVLWAKSTGGNDYDMNNSVVLDATGNTYVAGWFYSTIINFDSTTLVNTDGTGSSADIFLLKYDVNGNALWAKSADGTADDQAGSIAIDTSGNAYLAGWYASSTIIFDSITLTNAGGYDIFLVKFDPNGNIIWGKRAGGTNADGASSVAINTSDNIFLTGSYQSTSITFGSTTLTNAGYSDIFLSKLDNIVTASNDIYNSSYISVFPNPVTEYITINVPQKSTIEIADINGQIVRTIYNIKEATIEISDLSSGVYILRVKTDKEIVTKKFIKE